MTRVYNSQTAFINMRNKIALCFVIVFVLFIAVATTNSQITGYHSSEGEQVEASTDNSANDSELPAFGPVIHGAAAVIE